MRPSPRPGPESAPAGFRTESVGDCESARTRIEHAADLVLLDISLPKQSGIWVLQRLREAGNHVPDRAVSAPG